MNGHQVFIDLPKCKEFYQDFYGVAIVPIPSGRLYGFIIHNYKVPFTIQTPLDTPSCVSNTLISQPVRPGNQIFIFINKSLRLVTQISFFLNFNTIDYLSFIIENLLPPILLVVYSHLSREKENRLCVFSFYSLIFIGELETL